MILVVIMATETMAPLVCGAQVALLQTSAGRRRGVQKSAESKNPRA